MVISIEINDDVPIDEVLYILRRLDRKIELSGFNNFANRVFNSAGDPVGTAAFETPHPVPIGVPESPQDG